MKAGLAQIAPALGDVKKNLDLHLECIAKAREQKTDLLVFPELSLTGYTLKDMTEDVALDPEKDQVFRKLRAAGGEMSVVVGFIEERKKGLFCNSAAFLSKGKILHIHRKVFLPTFGMFEEGKFFAPGKNLLTFRTPFGRAGLMICRDFLNPGACYLLLAGGADLIIVISAAPGRGMSEEEGFASSRMWELMGESVSRFSTVFVLYCNRTGFEDGAIFAGGSFIFNPMGRLLVRAPDLEMRIIFQEIDLEELRDARKNWPFYRDDRPEIILESLKRIVAGYED